MKGMNIRRAGYLGLVGLVLIASLVLSSCAPRPVGATGTEIVEAKDVAGLLGQANTVLVDARGLMDYRDGHIPGAVNIPRPDIVVMTPFPAMLAPSEKIAQTMGSRGINNQTLVVVYDDNQMDAARLWWTLKVYGHDNVKVVSGGIDALVRAGFELTTTAPTIQPATFNPGPLRQEMLVEAFEIRSHVNEPRADVVLIDTRSEEEHFNGHIPGSNHMEYLVNYFRDKTFRPVNHIRIMYLEQGIDYQKEVWLYCHTSIRAAPTFLALYNAGYRNIRLYDGAWVQWSANPLNPVYVPEVETMQLRSSDQS